MSILRRNEIPLVIASAVTTILLLDFFEIGTPEARVASTTLQSWGIILGAFVLGIGAIQLIRVQGGNIMKKSASMTIKLRAVWIIGLAIIVVAAGLADLNFRNPIFRFLMDNFYSRIYAASWSIVGLFYAYGFWRAFRVRSLESGIMVVATIIVMLKESVFGEIIFGKPIVDLGNWIMNVPNLGGLLAITFAGSFGIILVGLRTILGKERGYLRGSS